MRKVAIALVLVVGIAVLAMPLIGGFLARKAHAVLVDNLDQVELSTRGAVRVTNEGFELGWLSSKARMRVDVGLPGASWTFPLVHVIHHGPLPVAYAARGLSMAVIDTTLEGALAADGKPPFRGETVIDLTGDLGVDLTSLALPRREEVAWEGGSASLRLAGQGTRIAAQASAPRFEFRGAPGEFLLESLKVDYTAERMQAGPSVGSATYALARARVTSPQSNRNLGIDGFSWSSSSAFNSAGKLDSSFALRLAGLDLDDRSYRDAGFDLALRNLDTAAWQSLSELLQQIGRAGASQAPEQIWAEFQSGMLRLLPAVLASSPEIEIKGAHVATLDGRIDADLRLERDPASAGTGQDALLVQGRLVLPLSLFGALTLRAAGELSPAARRANDTQALSIIADRIAELLLTRGYFKEEEDGRLASDIAYGKGQVALNGEVVGLTEVLTATGLMPGGLPR